MPAVSVMLLSCAAYIAVVACQLLLDEKLPQSSKLYLRGAALLGTVVFNYMVSRVSFCREQVMIISFAASQHCE